VLNETELKGNASDYLAAERTFLAWVRTALTLMAFGFVVARFGLFLRELQIRPAEPARASIWLLPLVRHRAHRSRDHRQRIFTVALRALGSGSEPRRNQSSASVPIRHRHRSRVGIGGRGDGRGRHLGLGTPSI